MSQAPHLRMYRTLARVLNVGDSWFTFVLPETTFDNVFWMGRTQIPIEVDNALDYGQMFLHVRANLQARDASHVQFVGWERA